LKESPAAPSEPVLPAVAETRKKKDDSPRKPSRGKIGGLLVERGVVQASDITRALEEQEHGDRRRLGEILVALGLAKLEDVLVAQQTLEAKPRDTAPETIRVGVNLLDKLMTLVGELVLARNRYPGHFAKRGGENHAPRFGHEISGGCELNHGPHFTVFASSWAGTPRFAKHESRPRRDLACPLHRLPVKCRHVALVEMKLAGQLAHAFPVPGFLRQHELIERPQTAGSA
jgi:hypothetical protein